MQDLILWMSRLFLLDTPKILIENELDEENFGDEEEPDDEDDDDEEPDDEDWEE